MRTIDVDSHFMEPPNWLEHTDAALAAELPPPQRAVESLAAAFDARAAALPEGIARPDNPLELVATDMRILLEKTDTLQPDHYDATSGNPYYCTDARIAHCDATGIDVQWLNPSALLADCVQAMFSGKVEQLPRLKAAWNTFAADHVAGHQDRLQPVTQINFQDVEWSVSELTRMREAGSRAFTLEQHPTKSLTHPDFEPLWSAAEDLGMAAYAHVFFGQSMPHPSWLNNGRGLAAFKQSPGTHTESIIGIRNLLSALVIDGVLENHPNLRIVISEAGYSWFPSYLKEIDNKASKVGLDGLPQESAYRMPLLPSEYIQQHVRVSPLIGLIENGTEYMPLADAIDALPDPGLLVFSSDYPHIEGRADAVDHFDRLLPNDTKRRERFFGGSMEAFLPGL